MSIFRWCLNAIVLRNTLRGADVLLIRVAVCFGATYYGRVLHFKRVPDTTIQTVRAVL